MKNKTFVGFLLIVLFVGFWLSQRPALVQQAYEQGVANVIDAGNMQNNTVANAQKDSSANTAIVVGDALSIILVVGGVAVFGFSHAKKQGLLLLLLVLIMPMVAACAKTKSIVEIEAHQTAFLIPMSASAEQTKFDSVDYLEAQKVPASRFEINREWVSEGNMPWQGDFRDSVRLIIIDRQPVTRNWMVNPDVGQGSVDEAFYVSSKDSIEFNVGVVSTARIDPENAATYLFYYSTRPLSTVMDENIRGYIQSELSREVAKLTYKEAEEQKDELFVTLKETTTQYFKKFGVTIESLGSIGGFDPVSDEIQAALNSEFNRESQLEEVKVQATAAAVENEEMLSRANAQATATVIAGQAGAEALAAKAEVLAANPGLVAYTYAESYSGAMPNILFIGGEKDGTGYPFQFLLEGQGTGVIPTFMPANPVATSTPVEIVPTPGS